MRTRPAGSPDEFKLFKWGLIPFFMTDADKAMGLRAQTLNCISEEMYEKPSFRDAIKNGQRCLIPFKGCFEWRWLDEKGTIKVPYFIDFQDEQLRSMAGLYSRWKDPRSGQYYYSYTVLTTEANPMFAYIHNSKFRMPVFLRKEDERAWLDKNLSKPDVLNLCQPSLDLSMRAHTITKPLTTRNVNTNVPGVLTRLDYNIAIRQAEQYLKAGDKKALEAFKHLDAGDKVSIEDLQLAAQQKIKTELALAA
jgi:putative SOS response-associated peptidase YedK